MTTTIWIKRAGLVWALLLLATTYFNLTCAVPSGDGTGRHNPGGPEGNGGGNIIEEHPSVSTTPLGTSMDGVDSSKKSTKGTSDTPAVSNDSNSDDDTDKYLYYKITKRIFFERNLNLSDIKYVLSQKDDESLFMYALADKLGYMSEGDKPNDPHIPVIRSHREKLIELLEKMAVTKKPKPPVSQEHDEGPSVSSDEMPASKRPPSLKKIGYEVAADIRDLGPDAIRKILSDLTFSDTLGYTVGLQLGYSQGDEHMKYLEDANADELKRILQQILESKTTSKTTPDGSIDNSRNEPAPSEGGQEAGNSNGGQRQGGESNQASKETGERSKLLLPQNNGDTQDTQEQTLPPTVELPTKEEEEDLQVTKPSAKPEPEDSMGGANEVRGGSSDNHGADKVPSEKMEGKISPNEENSKSKDGDPNEVRPSSPDDILYDESSNDNDNGGGLRIGEAEYTRLLNSDEFQNFLEIKHSELYGQWMMEEADPNEIDLVMEEYLELLSVSGRSGVTKDGEGGENESSEVEAGDGDVPEKTKEDSDSSDHPTDSDVQAKGALDSLGDDKDDVEYDRPRSSSSFGALHFLSIFLVLGVLVVIGYFCIHNRKKIHERVTTYINDSGKRRKRAQEYKPLIST